MHNVIITGFHTRFKFPLKLFECCWVTKQYITNKAQKKPLNKGLKDDWWSVGGSNP